MICFGKFTHAFYSGWRYLFRSTRSLRPADRLPLPPDFEMMSVRDRTKKQHKWKQPPLFVLNFTSVHFKDQRMYVCEHLWVCVTEQVSSWLHVRVFCFWVYLTRVYVCRWASVQACLRTRLYDCTYRGMYEDMSASMLLCLCLYCCVCVRERERGVSRERKGGGWKEKERVEKKERKKWRVKERQKRGTRERKREKNRGSDRESERNKVEKWTKEWEIVCVWEKERVSQNREFICTRI